MKRSDYQIIVAHVYGAFYGVFILLAFCTIYESNASMSLSKLGLASIAPSNLRTAPEGFRLQLKVEQRDLPVEAMVQTESWEKLNASVNAYADRLEMMEQQRSSRNSRLRWLYLISAVGMLMSHILSRVFFRNFFKGSDANSTEVKASVPPSE